MGDMTVGGGGGVQPIKDNAQGQSSQFLPSTNDYSDLQSTIYNKLNINNFYSSVYSGTTDSTFTDTIAKISDLLLKIDPDRFYQYIQADNDADFVKMDQLNLRDANFAQENTQKGMLYGQLSELKKNLVDVANKSLEYKNNTDNLDALKDLQTSYNSLIQSAKNLPGNVAQNVTQATNPIISLLAPEMQNLANEILKDRNSLTDPINTIKGCNDQLSWDHRYAFPPDNSRSTNASNILTTTQRMSANIVKLQNYMSVMPKEYQDEFNAGGDPLKGLKEGVNSLNVLADNEVNGVVINSETKILSDLHPYEYPDPNNDVYGHYPSLVNANWTSRFNNINSIYNTDVLNFDFDKGEYPDSTIPT